MGNEFSFAELTRIIQKRLKFILAIAVIAGVLAIVFSGETFIKPRYKSSAIAYASNIGEYSDESTTEQLQQLFESSDVRDSIIKKFNLFKHYEIDEKGAGAHFMANGEYNSRVQIKKTKYEAVEITVEDESPKMAFDMTNELMRQVNLKARNLQRSKSQEVVDMSTRQLAEQKLRLDSLDRRLNVLRKENGLLEYEMQTQEASKGMYRLAAGGKSGSKDYNDAKRTLDNLIENGGEFKTLYEQQEYANQFYNKLMEQHQTALNDVRKELTYLNTVVYPEVADKKHYPVRWLIVFTAVFASILFSVVVFLFTEKRTVGNSAI
ncbi:MAG: Wzz/FepE/Etk N-terminal domain-containing protein [Bacteroidota bacterium]